MVERRSSSKTDNDGEQAQRGVGQQNEGSSAGTGTTSRNIDMEYDPSALQRKDHAPVSPSAASGSTQEQRASDQMSTPSRRGAQRLDSLKSSPSSSAGVSSGLRKTLKYQPRFTGRRSKEERDRIAQEENARIRERISSLAAEESSSRPYARKPPFGEGKRGRGSSWHRGRGGYMGESMAAGLISSGVISSERNRKLGARGGSRSAATSSRVGTSRVKNEPSIKVDADGDLSMLGIPMKREYDYNSDVSSDPDEGIEGPRKNVDFINLVSDEEDMDGNQVMSSGLMSRPKPAAPVRIQRKEHVNRATGIHSEAIPSNQTQSRRSGAENTRDDISRAARNTKVRSKEVEVLRSERKWKGVYGEDEEREDGVRVKEEPKEDSIRSIDIPFPQVQENPMEAEPLETHDESIHPLSADQGKKEPTKGKAARGKSYSTHPKPVFQTEEDVQEWHRRQLDLQVLREELAYIDEAQPSAELIGEDAAMQDRDIPDKKAERVYLFQFPPIVPDLSDSHVEVKEEPSSPTRTREQMETEPATAANSNIDQEPIKVEDDDEQGTAKTHLHHPNLASGKAGKLRVHESGRATLSWGGTSLELAMGTNAHFLQDAVLTSIIPAAQRIFADEGGEAMSLGQIRGKFVATPDWSEIMG